MIKKLVIIFIFLSPCLARTTKLPIEQTSSKIHKMLIAQGNTEVYDSNQRSWLIRRLQVNSCLMLQVIKTIAKSGIKLSYKTHPARFYNEYVTGAKIFTLKNGKKLFVTFNGNINTIDNRKKRKGGFLDRAPKKVKLSQISDMNTSH